MTITRIKESGEVGEWLRCHGENRQIHGRNGSVEPNIEKTSEISKREEGEKGGNGLGEPSGVTQFTGPCEQVLRSSPYCSNVCIAVAMLFRFLPLILAVAVAQRLPQWSCRYAC